MSNEIIQTQDLHFSYTTVEGTAPTVLNGVDIAIEEGSFVAILGHNGSGKSTLAKHMNAILLPSGGTVYVDGMDTAEEEKLKRDLYEKIPPRRRKFIDRIGYENWDPFPEPNEPIEIRTDVTKRTAQQLLQDGRAQDRQHMVHRRNRL